jgi:hypothetical protein
MAFRFGTKVCGVVPPKSILQRNILTRTSFTFNSAKLEQTDLESVLAHELGHKAIERGYVAMTGKNQESAADNFAAMVTSPQRVVDMLKNCAQSWPETNAIHEPQGLGPAHPSAYERALAVANAFPGQVDLKDFPIPSSPPVTVNGIADPVPVIASPLPSQLTVPNNSAIAPAGAGRPAYRAGLRDIQASTAAVEIKHETEKQVPATGPQRVRTTPPTVRVP